MAMSMESVQGSDEVDEMYCESCKTKGRSQPAEGFCVDCCYYLCSRCLECHSFLLPNHEQKDKFSMPQDFCLKPCAEHIDEILKFYCRSCKQFLCFLCKEKNHKKCRNVSHLPTLVQTLELKEKARVTCKVLEETLDSAITREKMVDDNIKSVDVLATKAKSEIDRQAQAVKDSVDASCLKLKQEVSTVESDDKAKLTLEKTQLNTLKSEVTSLKSDINNKEKTGKRCELFMSITTAEEMVTKDRVSRVPKTDVTEYKFEPATNLLDILRDQSLGHIKKSSIKDYHYECKETESAEESIDQYLYDCTDIEHHQKSIDRHHYECTETESAEKSIDQYSYEFKVKEYPKEPNEQYLSELTYKECTMEAIDSDQYLSERTDKECATID